MGNQLRKEYDIEDEPCGSGGLGLHWKIYNAVHIKTKQEVSIFILDKKSLPIRKNQYYDIFRRDINLAAQCKHNDILQIVNDSSKLESSSQLAFVSQRIKGSLADYINTDHVHTPRQRNKLNLGELRIKLGITQILSAIDYLHTVKEDNKPPMIHGFIDLCNVYIAQNGDWKLMGFSFTHPLDVSNTFSDGQYIDFSFGSYQIEKNIAFLPTYSCLAPEIYERQKIGTKSDVFSICRLICFVYMYYSDKLSEYPGCFLQILTEYQAFINNEDLRSSLDYTQFIHDECILQLLNVGLCKNVNDRADLKHFLESEVTQNLNVKVIRYLDELEHKEKDRKIAFISKLSAAVATFSYDIIIDKMIPNLIKQLELKEMQSCVLPLIFQLLQIHVEPVHFQSLIMPQIRPFLKLSTNEETFQVLAKNIGLITTYSSNTQRKHLVCDLYVKCLKMRFELQLQRTVMDELTSAVQQGLFEQSVLCKFLLPALGDILREKAYDDQIQTLTSLRVNVLMLFSKIFYKLTETEIVQFMIEPMKYLLSISRSPAILMSCLGVFQAIVQRNQNEEQHPHQYTQLIAVHLLPICSPIYLSTNLKPKQYKFCIKLMRIMLDSLEAYRTSSKTDDIVMSPTRHSTFSKAKKIDDEEVDAPIPIIAHIDPNKSPDVIISENDVSPIDREITPFQDDNADFFPIPPTDDEQHTLPSTHQSKNLSATFTSYNQSKTVANSTAVTQVDDDQKTAKPVTQLKPTATDEQDAWADFDGDAFSDEMIPDPIEPQHLTPGQRSEDDGDDDGKEEAAAAPENWGNFGRFSIDVGGWGSMSVDKEKFQDFDFGQLGKMVSESAKKVVIEEHNEWDMNDNEHKLQIMDSKADNAGIENPFAVDDDDGNEPDYGQEVEDTNDPNNPFAFDTPVPAAASPRNKKNVVNDQATDNTTNSGYDDPFKDLFG